MHPTTNWLDLQAVRGTSDRLMALLERDPTSLPTLAKEQWKVTEGAGKWKAPVANHAACVPVQEKSL